MPDSNGIDFSKEVYKYLPNCNIIFMTSYTEYMKEAFNLNVFSFIDKAEMEGRLSRTLNSFIDEYIDTLYLIFPTPKGNMFFKENEILFFEKANRKIFIQTKHEYIQIYYKNLKDIYELIKSPNFRYANQSSIVNLSWIARIKENEIFFKGIHNTHYISRGMKMDFDMALLEYKDG